MLLLSTQMINNLFKFLSYLNACVCTSFRKKAKVFSKIDTLFIRLTRCNCVNINDRQGWGRDKADDDLII